MQPNQPHEHLKDLPGRPTEQPHGSRRVGWALLGQATIFLLFAMLALTVLGLGCFGAQALWSVTHHRYDHPNAGFYYSQVSGFFLSLEEDFYTFSFEGKTEPRWRWTYSTNRVYQNLEFE